MRRIVLLCVMSMLFGGVSTLAAAEEVPGQVTAKVEVSGKFAQQGGTPSFRFTVNYSSDFENSLGDALLIYAEPSHTLLFAHVNSRFRLKGVGEEDLAEQALSLVYGRPGKRFEHTLSLPYSPKAFGDTRVEVVMRSHGQSYLLASGKVNVSDFQYSTTFSTVILPDGAMEYLGGTHCCSNVVCGKLCTSCPGAFFSCDLINCEISCEYF